MKRRESWEKSVRITQVSTLMDKHLTGKIEVLDTRLADKITGFHSFQPRLLSSAIVVSVRGIIFIDSSVFESKAGRKLKSRNGTCLVVS